MKLPQYSYWDSFLELELLSSSLVQSPPGMADLSAFRYSSACFQYPQSFPKSIESGVFNHWSFIIEVKPVSPPIHLKCNKIMRRTECILTGGKEAWIKNYWAMWNYCRLSSQPATFWRYSEQLSEVHSWCKAKMWWIVSFFWSSPIQLSN